MLEDILYKYICKTSYIIIKSINNFQWNSPMTVMDGLSFPSGLNVSLTSTFANGLFGLGSFGVPSTRVHIPMVTFQPITLYNTQQWSYNNQNDTNWSSLFYFKIPEWRYPQCENVLDWWLTSLIKPKSTLLFIMPLFCYFSAIICFAVTDFHDQAHLGINNTIRDIGYQQTNICDKALTACK